MTNRKKVEYKEKIEIGEWVVIIFGYSVFLFILGGLAWIIYTQVNKLIWLVIGTGVLCIVLWFIIWSFYKAILGK